MLKKIAATVGLAAVAAIAPGAAVASAYPAIWDGAGSTAPVEVHVPDEIPQEFTLSIPGVSIPTEGHSDVAAQVAPNQAVVDAAMSRVGTPYVYGASGPGAFDCSGLTQWSYAQAGKSIPRTSYDQLAGGQRVSGEWLPGDIVSFYGGGHVGLYIGGDHVVHAPTSGQSVHVASLNSMPADYAVRY